MLDYQEIINIICEMLKIGVPVGIIFHIIEYLLGYLFTVMFPKHFGSNRL